MAYKPTRRRGPNKARPAAQKIAGPDGDTIILATPPPAAEQAAPPSEPARRRKRADVGGQHLKLAAPVREGFQRRWVEGDPGRLAFFQELAYDFVSEPGIKSDSPNSRVRRLVGTQAGGAPRYDYLMETPLSEYQAGVDEKEEARRPFEEAISRGEDPLGSPLTAKTQAHQSSIR